MGVELYRRMPVNVEALQWCSNWDDMREFTEGNARMPAIVVNETPEISLLAGKDGAQGWLPVPFGYWVLRNPDDGSDYWPCSPEQFAATYEPVGPEPIVDEDTTEGAGGDGSDRDGDAGPASDGADSHDVGRSEPEPAPHITSIGQAAVDPGRDPDYPRTFGVAGSGGQHDQGGTGGAGAGGWPPPPGGAIQ